MSGEAERPTLVVEFRDAVERAGEGWGNRYYQRQQRAED